MSQEKVEKRKYEKKHRKEIEKKKKTVFAVKCLVFMLVIGAIIGVPVGINVYKKIPKFVGDSSLKSFVSTYIDDNHSDMVTKVKAYAEKQEDQSGTTENQMLDAVKDAIGEDANVVTPEEVDDAEKTVEATTEK